jgi:hypothetical protein
MYHSLKSIGWAGVAWVGLAGISPLHAQGVLPPQSSIGISTAPVNRLPLLIGDRLPVSITVSSDTIRSLISYKASIEVLAIAFLSPDCSQESAGRADWRRFYEAYSNWHVAFVAVGVGSSERAAQLAEDLKKNELPIHVVRDSEGRDAKALKITQIPTLVLIDESGIIRYRGPLGLAASPNPRERTKYAREAIEAIISHTDSVHNAEPPTSAGCQLP